VTQLSPHFSLAELTFSQIGARKGIDNTPPPEVEARLRMTAISMEAVRQVLGGKAISVSSGYRSPELNEAVGGSRTSAHTTGWAVDFNCHGFGSPLYVCRAIAASDLEFDQLIHEFGRWVHISFGPRLRRQLLTIGPNGSRNGLYVL
jgi:zinc D-Ala-D-Ala carboxypeptidase